MILKAKKIRFERIDGTVDFISVEKNEKFLYQFDLNLYLHHIKILSKKYNYGVSMILRFWIDKNYPNMIKLENIIKGYTIK